MTETSDHQHHDDDGALFKDYKKQKFNTLTALLSYLNRENSSTHKKNVTLRNNFTKSISRRRNQFSIVK